MVNTNKQSFYKTFEEKKLKKVVDYFYNMYIGGSENALLDNDDYRAWTEANLINEIKTSILSEKYYLHLEDSLEVLEAKHVRFMGEKRVTEIVEHRVKFRHESDGLWTWELK